MSQKSNAARTLVTAALIAAAYAALTYVSAAMGLAYGEVQFRLSEALCVLAAFTPAAIPGLTIGCVLGNITSPLGIADIVSERRQRCCLPWLCALSQNIAARRRRFYRCCRLPL